MIIQNDLTTENKIRHYYDTLKNIEKDEKKINLLKKQKQKIQEDINNTNIKLSVKLPNQQYDSSNITSVSNGSVQEKSLENAIIMLERSIEAIECEILFLQDNIRKMEITIIDAMSTIGELDQKDREIVELKFKYNKTQSEIAKTLNYADNSAVSRKLKKIIDSIKTA